MNLEDPNKNQEKIRGWDQMAQDWLPPGVANVINWVLPPDEINENPPMIKRKMINDEEPEPIPEPINDDDLPLLEDDPLFQSADELFQSADSDDEVNQAVIKDLLEKDEAELEEKLKKEEEANQKLIAEMMEQDEAEEAPENGGRGPIIIGQDVPPNQFRGMLRRLRDEPQFQKVEKFKEKVKIVKNKMAELDPEKRKKFKEKIKNRFMAIQKEAAEAQKKIEDPDKDFDDKANQAAIKGLMIKPEIWFNPAPVNQADFRIVPQQQPGFIDNQNNAIDGLDLEMINIEEQRRALDFIKRQQEQARQQIERDRLLKMIEGEDDEKEPNLSLIDAFISNDNDDGPDLSVIFDNFFDQDEVSFQTKPEVPKRFFKTGFGMYYVRWCLNNPGFDWFHQKNNLPMNKIDYFKTWVWDLLSDQERQIWLTRAFYKNNNMPDPDEEREIQKIQEAKNKFQDLPINQPPGWVNPKNGCNCGDCYRLYRQNYNQLPKKQKLNNFKIPKLRMGELDQNVW